MRTICELFLAVAMILGAARFSFAQDTSVAALADSQDSGAALSATAAGGSAADAERQGTQPDGAQAPEEQSDSAKPAAQNTPPPQPKRILGVMPNFRAGSAPARIRPRPRQSRRS